MNEYHVFRLDMANHGAGHIFELSGQVRKFLNNRVTSGPYVIVDKDGAGPQRQKGDSLAHLVAKIDIAKPGDVLDWHPDSGSQWRTRVKVAAPVYMNPFRDAHTTQARTDAGVDKCGTGPVSSIGKAKILQVGVPSHTSTFGNQLSTYELLEGPGKGFVVFFAEHYNVVRQFKAGDVVDPSMPLWIMNGCVEIGWGSSDGMGSAAWVSGQYFENERSTYGENMSELLVALGGSGGLTTGRPLIDRPPLPKAYPRNWAELV